MFPLRAMDQVAQEQEERSLSTVFSEVTQRFVIRLVIFNCVQRGDFEGVSHLIEKTGVHPGRFVIDLIETGPVIGVYYYLRQQNIGVFGYSYLFYKAAIHSGHRLLIRLIRDSQSLCQAEAFASLFEDPLVASIICKHADFSRQKIAYDKLVEANEAVARRKQQTALKLPARDRSNLTQSEKVDSFNFLLSRYKKVVQEERMRLFLAAKSVEGKRA